MTDSMWLLVTIGRGPNECKIAAKKIAMMIYDEAQILKLGAYIPEHQEDEYGWQSALISLETPSEEFAQSWEGTIQWTCPSPIRKAWKRKNWFVSVSVIRHTPLEYSFKDTDLKFDSFRAQGKGGQHVNVTDSAVRITHLPTGITAMAQEERSQYRNKSLALARLSDILKQNVEKDKKAVAKQTWQNHNEIERGNPIKIFRGPDFK